MAKRSPAPAKAKPTPLERVTDRAVGTKAARDKSRAEQDQKRRAAIVAAQAFPGLNIVHGLDGKELTYAAKCQLVAIMSACGVSPLSMSFILGLTVEQMRREFGPQVDEGNSFIVARSAKSLFEIDNDPYMDARARVPALIFLLKTRGGWREIDKVPTNEPPGISRDQATFNYSNLSDEEREQFLMLLDKTRGPARVIEQLAVQEGEQA